MQFGYLPVVLTNKHGESGFMKSCTFAQNLFYHEKEFTNYHSIGCFQAFNIFSGTGL